MANVTFMEQLNGIIEKSAEISQLKYQLSDELDNLADMIDELLSCPSSKSIMDAINKDTVSQFVYRERMLRQYAGYEVDERCKFALLALDDARAFQHVMKAVTAEILKEEST